MDAVTDPELIGKLEAQQQAPLKRSAVDDPVKLAQLDFGIDVTRPKEEVRAAIGKLDPKDRVKALDHWANHYVAQENKDSPVLRGIDKTVRSAARGTFIGPLADEGQAALQKIMQYISGGHLGSDYDETLAYQRAKDRSDDEDLGLTGTGLKIAGGLAGGLGALKAVKEGGTLAQAAGTAVGGPLATVELTGNLATRAAKGAGMGGLWGGTAAFGNAEGGEGSLEEQAKHRLEESKTGGLVGAGIGALIPPLSAGGAKVASLTHELVSPGVARYSTELRQLLERVGAIKPEPRPRSLSAAAVPNPGAAPPASGAEAAADQIIANQLARANVSVGELRNRISQARTGQQFHSNSFAEDAIAPVDLDPSLQRLLGSATRQQPEAANMAQAFQFSRQTGLPPPHGNLPPNASLTTRDLMAAKGPDDAPAGQFERVFDALKRAFTIKDSEFHGIGANAYQTDNLLAAGAKAASDPAYRAAYKAADGYDLRQHLQPIIDKWKSELVNQDSIYPPGIKRAIANVIKQFAPKGTSVNNLEAFDKAKQFIDGEIAKYFEKGTSGLNRYTGGIATQVKNELLEAVDGIKQNGIGSAYSNARSVFAGPAEARKAIQIGRDLSNEEADAAIDIFSELSAEGKKLARLGFMDAIRSKAARSKRSADITQLFESPRMQEILEAMIPRDQNFGGKFANRPERFGQFLQNEKRMIGTRDEVLGNSKTAQRLVDDQAFGQLESVNQLFGEFAKQPTASNIAIRAMEYTLDKLFGTRADTASEIARKLLTVDPQQRTILLQRLEDRLGPSRSAQFARLMQDYTNHLARIGSIPGAQPNQNGGP